MAEGSHNSASRSSEPATARDRELRAQGRKTRRKLADAGLRVFARRGYQEARVDDIVRAARTSYGTFYLYFANKEDLLGGLAVECAAAIEELASRIPAVSPGGDGTAALRRGDPGLEETPGRGPGG